MKKTVLTASLVLGCCMGYSTAQEPDFPVRPLPLTRGGRSIYAIVVPDAAFDWETYAAEELAEFMARGTGANLEIVREGEFSGRRGLYVGETAFAVAAGVEFDGLGDEEWLVKASGQNLIIAGGRPRGTLYGTYAFLETFLGVRFLNPKLEHVPTLESLAVPADTELSGKPAFSRREVSMFLCFGHIERNLRFMIRSRMNSVGNAGRRLDARYGYAFRYGSPYSTHVSHRYVLEFPEAFDREEFFAVNEYGERYEREVLGKYQVCMSHPEGREVFARKLRVYIERDRQEILDAGGEAAAFPVYYSLVPDDGHSKCYCDRCLEREDQYGSYAGVLLEFANYLADAIAEDYPEIVLRIGAYSYHRDLPEGIRPRENVIVSIAQLGAVYWDRPPKRDIHRSLLHPLNAGPRREFEQWAEISPGLSVHDYWILHWGQPHQWPHSDIGMIAENLNFYHAQGVDHYFTEAPLLRTSLNFLDLRYYLASRLMLDDPAGDPAPVIDAFMGLYYGAAAPRMQELMGYMERRQEEEPGYLEQVPPTERAYFDAAYFLEADRLLSAAEMAVSEDGETLAAVLQERLPFDETMLFLWDKLETEAGEAWPFERADVLERVASGYENLLEKYGAARGHYDRVKERLEHLRTGAPIKNWMM